MCTQGSLWSVSAITKYRQGKEHTLQGILEAGVWELSLEDGDS